MSMSEDLAIAEAVFRHHLATRRGTVVFLALGSGRDDPPPILMERLGDGGIPVKPVSAANTSERTETHASSTTVTLPSGPWWRNILAMLGLMPTGTVTSGADHRTSVVFRRLTDAETGATGTLVRVGAIRHLGPDEAEVESEISGEPLPTVNLVCRVVRGADGWTVADTRNVSPT